MSLLDFLTVLVSCITIFLVVVSFFVVKFKVVEYEEIIKKDSQNTQPDPVSEKIKKLKERKPRKKKETKKREKPTKKDSVKSR